MLIAMAKLKPFSAGINTYVDRDVLDLLDQPSHIRQARVVILAVTKKAALEYVASLPGKPIGPPYASEVRVASGNDVDALADAGLLDAPAVFVMPLSGGSGAGVVRVDKDGPRLIGELLRSGSRSEFEPVGTITVKVTPTARERLARHLYLADATDDWRATAETGWDRCDERINREAWLAKADELVAILSGDGK